MTQNPTLSPPSPGSILRRTCLNTGHPGWQLSFVRNAATLAIHFSDRLHGGSAPSRAAAQRALNELTPILHDRYRRAEQFARC